MNEQTKVLVDNESIITNNTSKSTEFSSNSFNNFVNNNKNFFIKLGLEEFINDPIFKLKSNEEAKPEIWNYEQDKINKDLITSCFECNDSVKTTHYCKYCGTMICSKCKPKQALRENKLICSSCIKKFEIYEIQMTFKQKFENIENEIKELSQSAETIGLKLSESTHEVDEIKQQVSNNQLEYKIRENNLIKEKESIKAKIALCDTECISVSNKINSLIEDFKIKDEEFNLLDNEYKSILNEREEMYKQYILKQDKLNRLSKDNQELSLNLQNYENQINKRIVIDFSSPHIETLYLESVNKQETINDKSSVISLKSTKSILKRLGTSLLNK